MLLLLKSKLAPVASATLASALVFVKYRLVPSDKSLVLLLLKSKLAPVASATLASALVFVKYRLVPSDMSLVVPFMSVY